MGPYRDTAAESNRFSKSRISFQNYLQKMRCFLKVFGPVDAWNVSLYCLNFAFNVRKITHGPWQLMKPEITFKIHLEYSKIHELLIDNLIKIAFIVKGIEMISQFFCWKMVNFRMRFIILNKCRNTYPILSLIDLGI